MKIETQNQQLAAPQPAKVGKGQKARAVELPQEQAAKTQAKPDRVELSGKTSLSAEIGELQAIQGKKVQSIKERIDAGTYQVSGREVAESMLSKLARNKR